MNKGICTIPSCRNYEKYCRIHSVQTFKPAAKINKVADSQKEAEREYKKLAKAYITLHPKCGVKGCQRPSECIHHQKGRIGDLLLDTKYFLAVCLPCHQKIEQHPGWAREMGYSLSRHKQTASATTTNH